MMFEVHRAAFLKPSEMLYDLLALQHAESGLTVPGEETPVRYFPAGVLEDCIERLVARELIVADSGTGRVSLTAAGRRQLRVLMVDYTRELNLLYEEMLGVFRSRLMEFYLAGARAVAFYPIGDTAHVAYLALKSSGLNLAAAVDDDPLLWGADFHGVKIESLESLRGRKVDAIILTTSVFESQVRERLANFSGINARILSMWQ